MNTSEALMNSRELVADTRETAMTTQETALFMAGLVLLSGVVGTLVYALLMWGR